MIFTLDDSTPSNYCRAHSFLISQPGWEDRDMSWTVDPMHTQVEFSAKHMGLMTVKGHFTNMRVSIALNEDDFTASSVEATIETHSLITNDARRDAHLKSPDFLNVEQFPTLTFKSTRVERAAHDHYKMTGDLTIRNVTRPVTLDVVYSGQAKDPMGGVHAGFSAHTSINRKDWGLTWNVALETGGFLVGEEVELATAALEAGKAVYCEWPLGNGLREAESLSALAKKKGVLAVVGLQARSAPAVAYVRDLITQGYVGEVLSTTLIGSGMGWGPTVEPYNAYLNDKKNGATMLSIAVGHATDALCHCLGEVRELSATVAVRRKSFTIAETGGSKPMTAHDQVCVTGLLQGGAALSIHYRGGRSRGTNLMWEINGTEGDLQLTAAGGQAQISERTVPGGKGAQSSPQVLPVP